MTNHRTAICVAALWALGACADSSTTSDATGAMDGGAGHSGSGGAHAAGTSGSGSSGPSTGGRGSSGLGGNGGAGASAANSCNQLAGQCSDAVQAAITAAGLACSAKADCELISVDTDCFASCGALVGPDAKKAAEAAIRAQNEGVCKDFQKNGCQLVIPPCAPPLPDGFDCVAGQCRSKGDAEPGSDAGARSDGGGSASGCVEQAIMWGPNGGFALQTELYTLMPCDDFSLKRTVNQEPGSAITCENKVAAGAAVSIADLNAALADADVKAAIAAAPVLYGVDSRPVDGSVFRVEIGKAVIDVGGDCGSGGGGPTGCDAIPSGVSKLQTTLNALTDQQKMIPNCDSVH